jgi:hypothetical protein
MKTIIKGLLKPGDYAFVKIRGNLCVGKIDAVRIPKHKPPFSKSTWFVKLVDVFRLDKRDPTKRVRLEGGWYSIDDLLLFGIRLEE